MDQSMCTSLLPHPLLVQSMYGQHFQRSMDQPGMVANPARGLARQVRQSRPASGWSFNTLRLNLVLTRGISAAFRDGVPKYRHSTSGQSRGYQVTQMCTDGV